MKKSRVVLGAVFFVCLFSVTAQSAAALYERGIAAEGREDWYTATQYFIEATTINPSYGDAWFHLAECAYHLEQYDVALSYLESAEKLQRNNTALYNLRGLSYIALGRTADARVVFTDVLSRAPNDVDARFGLAELDLLEGKMNSAEQLYREALSRQATNRKALLSLALVSAALNQPEQAQQYMNQALRYYSGDATVHYLAACLASLSGDYVQAERQARVAVEVNGSYDQAYALLASVLYVQGKYREAEDICDFRIGTNRLHGDAWYLKGLSLYRQGKIDGAITTWSAGLVVVPDDEVMRAALELTVNESLPIEDARRP
ncbi:MAG: tetratricopeptide repeat protein, partial [Treponema sp.]|nr:tetratricopeptide repeat protein [Treponema sp.]